MSLDVFLSFDGNCRQALDFYSGAFGVKPENVQVYGDNPDGAPPADKERILYACIPVAGGNLMLSDCPSNFAFKRGNNVMLTIGLPQEAEIRRIFDALMRGGASHMPLEKTFFSPLFGMVEDKFGIIWQISLAA